MPPSSPIWGFPVLVHMDISSSSFSFLHRVETQISLFRVLFLYCFPAQFWPLNVRANQLAPRRTRNARLVPSSEREKKTRSVTSSVRETVLSGEKRGGEMDLHKSLERFSTKDRKDLLQLLQIHLSSSLTMCQTQSRYEKCGSFQEIRTANATKTTVGMRSLDASHYTRLGRGINSLCYKRTHSSLTVLGTRTNVSWFQRDTTVQTASIPITFSMKLITNPHPEEGYQYFRLNGSPKRVVSVLTLLPVYRKYFPLFNL